MKKFLGYRFWVIVILFAALLQPTVYNLQPVYAGESSPSADIKIKLEELKKEIASKAAKLKQEVNRKLKDKAYAGRVKSKSPNSLTLATSSGPKIVSINQDTILSNKQTPPKNSKTKTKQISSINGITFEDYIVALGDADETGVLTAKKIILLNAPPSEAKTYFWGQIASISDKLVTLKSTDQKSITATLPANSEIKLNDLVILTGNKNENDIIDSGFIYVYPQGIGLKPKKVATPEAQIATPSAKASPTAKPKKTSSPKPSPR